MQDQTIQFENGRAYSMSSPCDHNCIWTFLVVKRTAKTVTLMEVGGRNREKVCRVSNYDGAETVMLLGRYSMAPVLKATRWQ